MVNNAKRACNASNVELVESVSVLTDEDCGGGGGEAADASPLGSDLGDETLGGGGGGECVFFGSVSVLFMFSILSLRLDVVFLGDDFWVDTKKK